jgi:hypothetical protein
VPRREGVHWRDGAAQGANGEAAALLARILPRLYAAENRETEAVPLPW